jgi:hypothetical protein
MLVETDNLLGNITADFAIMFHHAKAHSFAAAHAEDGPSMVTLTGRQEK